MSSEIPDLARALCDVRRAYRLLHAYHRRICDLFQTVDERLVRSGFTFEHWAPINVWSLPKSTKPFFRPETWAWDLTPGYQVRCEWGQSKKGQTRRVVIEAIADTGFDPDGEGEPDPRRFEPVEGCATELRTATWLARTAEPDWEGAWKEVQRRPTFDDGSEKGVTIGTVKYVYRYLGVSVAELVDKNAVETKLLQPLEQRLKSLQA